MNFIQKIKKCKAGVIFFPIFLNSFYKFNIDLTKNIVLSNSKHNIKMSISYDIKLF
jgi:hypothetical protein